MRYAYATTAWRRADVPKPPDETGAWRLKFIQTADWTRPGLAAADIWTIGTWEMEVVE